MNVHINEDNNKKELGVSLFILIDNNLDEKLHQLIYNKQKQMPQHQFILKKLFFLDNTRITRIQNHSSWMASFILYTTFTNEEELHEFLVDPDVLLQKIYMQPIRNENDFWINK